MDITIEESLSHMMKILNNRIFVVLINIFLLFLFSTFRNEMPDYLGSEKDRVRVIVR
jgi:hypothetical protein